MLSLEVFLYRKNIVLLAGGNGCGRDNAYSSAPALNLSKIVHSPPTNFHASCSAFDTDPVIDFKMPTFPIRALRNARALSGYKQLTLVYRGPLRLRL